jgi:hypothetical protein
MTQIAKLSNQNRAKAVPKKRSLMELVLRREAACFRNAQPSPTIEFVPNLKLRLQESFVHSWSFFQFFTVEQV